MTRRMSVALSLPAVRARTKTVTRRRADTWSGIATGDRLVLVEKAQGLPKGAKQVVVAEVEVVDVRVEPLARVDAAELVAEGFAGANLVRWMAWWAECHGYRAPRRLTTGWAELIPVRRIEWRYIEPGS